MQGGARNYLIVTASYWGFTLVDGALRMLVLFHFFKLGYSPFTLAFLFLLFPAALAASTIYFFLVRDWGASRTGTYAFISPVIAVLLGAGLNDEALGLTEALGIAMMLAASWMVLRRA